MQSHTDLAETGMQLFNKFPGNLRSLPEEQCENTYDDSSEDEREVHSTEDEAPHLQCSNNTLPEPHLHDQGQTKTAAHTGQTASCTAVPFAEVAKD